MIDPVEPILQTYAIPLSAFLERNEALDVSTLEQIGFVFDQADEGRVALDDIGFSIQP